MEENDIYSKRTRHIDIRHHFIKEHIAKGLIEMRYVPSSTQLADALTKALEQVLHNRFVASVMYDTAEKEKLTRLLGKRKLFPENAGRMTDERHPSVGCSDV